LLFKDFPKLYARLGSSLKEKLDFNRSNLLCLKLSLTEAYLILKSVLESILSIKKFFDSLELKRKIINRFIKKIFNIS